MKKILASVLLCAVSSAAFAQPIESIEDSGSILRNYSKVYSSEYTAYAKRYCQVGGSFKNCSVAAEVAMGDALSVCYKAGNSICDVKLVQWVAIGGSCAQKTDYCHATALAVPHSVERTQYIGNAENAP